MGAAERRGGARLLDVSLERLGVDYVDYYLLHNLAGKRTAKFDEFGLWDYFARKKAEGKIRYLGFSSTTAPMFSTRCSRSIRRWISSNFR